MMRRVPEQYLPKAIHQQADTHKLGSLQRIYEHSNFTLFYCLSGIICMLFGALLINAFLLYYHSTFSTWPLWQAYMLPTIAIGWFLLGLWLLLTPLFSPTVRTYIFSRGFIYQKRKTAIKRWQQVEVFWKELRTHKKTKERHYTLKCDDGSIFVLSSQLEEFELLAHFLDKVIKNRWLPVYISAYYHKEKLDFQEIMLDALGVHVTSENHWLPWQNFGGTTLDETTLSIYSADKAHRLWTALSSAQLPNIAVLQNLLEHIQTDQARYHSPLITAYLAGAQINFGKLSIGPQGLILHNLRETLPWSDIASIGIGESEVIIRRSGTIQEWYAVPLWAIDNAAELKDLLDYMMLHRYV